MPPMATAVDTESPTRVGVNRLVKYSVLTRVPSTAAVEGTA